MRFARALYDSRLYASSLISCPVIISVLFSFLFHYSSVITRTPLKFILSVVTNTKLKKNHRALVNLLNIYLRFE